MTPRAGKPGVRQLAQHAGVSVGTVSRVLNKSPQVDPQTRARVEAAIHELRYVRHGVARSLSLRRSRCIGIIVPVLGTAVYAEAVGAVEQRLQEAEYRLLTACCGYDPAKELEFARAFVEHGVDGLILVGNTHKDQLYELVDVARLPAVQTFVDDPASRLVSIGFDNFQPSYDLARVLAWHGHRNVAVLHSPLENNDRIQTRYKGICRALSEHGAGVDPALVVEAGYTISGGRAGLRRLLACGRRFSAIACTGDVLAIGALIEARRQGIAVPGQLSVTGFHDLDLAEHTDPPLTTVRAPIRKMGEAAAGYLLALLCGTVPSMPELRAEMVLRHSPGPALEGGT